MFGRRKAETVSATTDDVALRTGGKGRATPSRKEAEAARKKRLAPPRTRKEASAQRREKMRESKVAQRAALDGTGDDSYLPARDQGPERRFLRDYVDVRRTIGEFMLPLFFLIFISVSIKQEWAQRFSSSAFLVVIVVMVLDAVRIVRGSKSALREKFGDDAVKGNTMYTLLRSWQMRRLRLPKPRVKAGDKI